MKDEEAVKLVGWLFLSLMVVTALFCDQYSWLLWVIALGLVAKEFLLSGGGGKSKHKKHYKRN